MPSDSRLLAIIAICLVDSLAGLSLAILRPSYPGLDNTSLFTVCWSSAGRLVSVLSVSYSRLPQECLYLLITLWMSAGRLLSVLRRIYRIPIGHYRLCVLPAILPVHQGGLLVVR